MCGKDTADGTFRVGKCALADCKIIPGVEDEMYRLSGGRHLRKVRNHIDALLPHVRPRWSPGYFRGVIGLRQMLHPMHSLMAADLVD
jgi:hypothetical protein